MKNGKKINEKKKKERICSFEAFCFMKHLSGIEINRIYNKMIGSLHNEFVNLVF